MIRLDIDDTLLTFHANLYAWPTALESVPPAEETASQTNPPQSDSVELRGQQLLPLRGPGGGPPRFLDPFPVSFEEMQQRLSEIFRMDCEPDGFFCVAGARKGVHWRLSGQMFELPADGSSASASQMHRIELNGQCPSHSLDEVLATLGWPATKVVFELVNEGVSLAESDFRKYASAQPRSIEPS